MIDCLIVGIGEESVINNSSNSSSSSSSSSKMADEFMKGLTEAISKTREEETAKATEVKERLARVDEFTGSGVARDVQYDGWVLAEIDRRIHALENLLEYDKQVVEVLGVDIAADAEYREITAVQTHKLQELVKQRAKLSEIYLMERPVLVSVYLGLRDALRVEEKPSMGEKRLLLAVGQALESLGCKNN